MRRAIDIIGQVFGQLTVVSAAIAPAHVTNPGFMRRAWWVCSCACGNERLANGIDLRKGKSKSCGCLKSETMRGYYAQKSASPDAPSATERKAATRERARIAKALKRAAARAARPPAAPRKARPMKKSNAPNSPWTPELRLTLVELWGSGKSASTIGAQLGVSKNAIIGAARRMGLTSRPSPIRRDPNSPMPPPAVPRPVFTLPPLFSETVSLPAPRPVIRREPQPEPIAIPRVDPSSPCCWHMGEPRTKAFRFCGDAAVRGRPYCPEHAGLAYVKVRQRQEAA